MVNRAHKAKLSKLEIYTNTYNNEGNSDFDGWGVWMTVSSPQSYFNFYRQSQDGATIIESNWRKTKSNLP